MKQEPKRWARSALALALSSLLLGGCVGSWNAPGETGDTPNSGTESSSAGNSSSQASGEPVTISYWSATASDDRNAWHAQAIEQFESENPNIQVEFLGVPGDTSAMTQKLDMAIAANSPPDAFGDFLQPTYIERGIIRPLDDYFANHKERDAFPDQYLDIYRGMDFKSEEPKLYAMPHGMNVQCLYIRPDIIAAAGLEEPTTWEEFFAIAEACTDRDSGLYGYIIRGGSGSATALYQLMYGYSGIDAVIKDGVCTLNDPLHVEFLERYLGGYDVYTSADDMNKTWTEMAAQFQSGKAVTLVHNLGSAEANYAAFDNDESKIKAIPCPQAVTGHITIPSFSPGGNMIPTGAAHPDEAWAFLEFLSSGSVYSDYCRMMGAMPMNTNSMQDSWIQDTSYMKMGADYLGDPDTVVCEIPNYLPNFNVIATTYAEPAIQQILIGQLSVQEFLDEWTRQVQEDYDQAMGK